MVRLAVILAAGMGSRLKKITKVMPKGFIEIDEKPIIEMSIEKLIEAGIEKIIVGTGHLAEAYEELALKYPLIQCKQSDKYHSTGSMYTLYNLKDLINEDFILLESDIIYDKISINILQNHNMRDVVLASGLTNSHDEVFIEVDKNYYLLNMSKNNEELNSIYGELVGISKISYECYKAMCDYTERIININPKIDYEKALVGISSSRNIYIENCGNLAWCEIDDKKHLFRAKNYIYPLIKARENGLKIVKRNVLLNPGPATTTETVKLAQVIPDICPREKEFGDVMDFVSKELTKFVGYVSNYTTVLFGGSGTAAVEAVLSSVVGDDVVLIINNGAYGKRMCQIANAYGLNYIEYNSSKVDALDFKNLENVIQNSSKKISHLAVVHNETTTGLLNDIEIMGNLCKKYNIDLIVDAMSSFAAVPIDMNKMNISFLSSSSNKSIQGMAGVSFVVANKEKLEISKSIKQRNFYLNLYSQYKYFEDEKQMRFTPPVQTLYALKQAIIEAKKEGLENRYKRYCKSWETLINGITKLGLTYLVDKENHSKIITTIVEPDCAKYNFNDMHDYLYSRGITIYPGKIDSFNTFRVANIGEINYKDIEHFLEIMGKYLREIGYIL